ncbi:hypothetical protein V2J09_017902 [Rumex salicifolius]
MAVEAVVAVVLQKLTDLLIEDSIAFDNVIDQIEDIRIQLRQMRGFLIDAEFRDHPGAFDWATDYLCLLFSAEDKIESYVLSLAAKGRRNIGFFQRRGFTLFAAAYDCCGPGKLLRHDLDNLAIKIKSLKLKRPDEVVDASLRAENLNPEEDEAGEEKRPPSACVIGRSLSINLHPESFIPEITLPYLKNTNSFPLNRRSNFRFGSPSPGTNRSPRNCKSPSYPDLDGPILIGFTQDKRKLADRLKGTGAGAGAGGGVIPLVGRTGSGKTTLGQTIYNLREIKTHFNCRAWVHVPDEFSTITQLLANLLQQVLKSQEGGGTLSVDQLKSRVRDSLNDKTYLIVLDHVGNVELWNELKSAMPNLGTGDSKVIVITREVHVASSICKQEGCSSHELKQLCDQHSWELLIKKSCLEQETEQVEYGFRHDILKKCDGRPLDIVLLGGLFSTKGPSCDEWIWYLSQAKWREMEILPLCYNDLPAHSKLCLLYMALFPNEVDVSVRRLRRLWLAEGFVRRSPGMSEEDTMKAHKVPIASCITPATEVGCVISKNIGDKGFGVLRVLDLEGVYKPTLPETLKQLFHLRYLGLRWTFIDHLPKSVGDLPYLETLDLKRTYINSVPSYILKLKHLRYLNLPEIRLEYKQKKHQDFLTQLRTLVGLVVDEEAAVKEELNQLYELQELGITCQSSFSEDFISWIQKLANLRYLSLKSKDKMGRPSKINLKPLLKLPQLSRLSLLGDLGKLPTSNAFPTNLKVLALSVSKLNDDPMTILSKLPYLCVLSLLADSYLGIDMNCPKNGFENLRVLKLWMLKELAAWTVEENGMPQLREMKIRHCRKLKRLTSRLMHQDTLEELTLSAMPEEFVEEVKKKKQRHTVLILNDYKFTPLPGRFTTFPTGRKTPFRNI